MASHGHQYHAGHPACHSAVTPAYPRNPSQSHGARQMGPPSLGPLEFPPQPVDIDLNSSKTMPKPPVSARMSFDSVLQPHGYGDIPYASNSLHQSPIDSQPRGPHENPIEQFYSTNDGPWIPQGVIPDVMERPHAKQAGNRSHPSYNGQYRQPNPSEAAYSQFGIPLSDSGYGTRRSVGNTSVFSADVNDRDQDCHSLAGHVADYQPFQPYNESMQLHDSRIGTSWTSPRSHTSEPPGLVCPDCHKFVKTPSELRKHDLRHKKPFVCKVANCSRKEGFSTTNDLERHAKSKHPSMMPEKTQMKRFRCLVQGCKSKEKSWPRLDNFRSHLKRVHTSELRPDEMEDLIRRAQYWQKSGQALQSDLPTQSHIFPEISAPAAAIGFGATSQPRKDLAWKSQYPVIIETSQDLILHEDREGGNCDPKQTSLPDERCLSPEVPQRDTVQPMDVLHPPSRILDRRMAMESLILAPSGNEDSVSNITDDLKTTIAHQAIPKGKWARQISPASDATATEIIKQALAIADASDSATNRTDSERTTLPSGRISCRDSRSAAPSADEIDSRESTSPDHRRADSPSADPDSRDCQAQQILRVIRGLGYTIQKNPSQSKRTHNPGSAASSKSDHLFACQTCKNFIGRPCELKKHLKRHERPYGCTFATCNKTFGSKNDWKRHENSQHIQQDTWRCDEGTLSGGTCTKVCYRHQTFRDHVKKEHHISDVDTVKLKTESCRIGRDCNVRFWCGFCVRTIDIKKKGLDACSERFDHIDDHFMARRGFQKQRIQDWVPIESDKPKSLGGGSSEKDDSHSSGQLAENTSPTSTSSGSGSPGGCSAHAIVLDGDETPTPVLFPKRHRSDSGDDGRSAKHARAAAVNREMVVYCCQCGIAHNPKLDQSCTSCEKSHVFCDGCTRELRRVQDSDA